MHEFGLLMTSTLSQAADHLRVVDSFRRRGVPSSAVHALLPNLLREVRAAGFQVPLIDVDDESAGHKDSGLAHLRTLPVDISSGDGAACVGDGRAFVFSCGRLVHFVVTGRTPLRGLGRRQIIIVIIIITIIIIIIIILIMTYY